MSASSEPEITWRRTFPECEPGTDGVPMTDGRVIGRVRFMSELPSTARTWMWSVTDPQLAGKPGWGADTRGQTTSREEAMRCLIERWRNLRVSASR